MPVSTRERLLVVVAVVFVAAAVAVRSGNSPPPAGRTMLLHALDDARWDGRLPEGCDAWLRNRHGGTDRGILALVELHRRAHATGGKAVADGERCAGVLVRVRALVAKDRVDEAMKILDGEAETLGIRD